jgi:hypothetical protein
MLVSEIITAARHYSQIAGANFYASEDELRGLNRAYRDIYERILQSDDEFFVTEITLLPASFTTVRERVYDVTLPADFYRLRNLVAVSGTSENQLRRKDPQDINQGEGYRFHNSGLRLFIGTGYDSYRLEYYPKPHEYTLTAEDIIYPPQLEPLILAYQMAMDIGNIQNADVSKHEGEYVRLWKRFELAISGRDSLRHAKTANVYRSTLVGW